jgi:hypothetical protein
MKNAKIALFLAAGLSPFAAPPARADEAGLSAEELNVYSPAVTRGERELETRAFVTKGHQQGYAFSAGYSPTSYWAAEAYEVLHRDPGGALVADVVELESRFALSSPGELWADLGAAVEVEIPQQAGNPGAARFAPILEKQFGRAVVSLNLPLEWKYGPNCVPGTTFAYGARAEYLLHPAFSPALEAFGEPGVVGRFNATADQTHSAGPAIYGSARVAARQTFRYSVASLFGLTSSSPGWTLVTRLELEF